MHNYRSMNDVQRGMLDNGIIDLAHTVDQDMFWYVRDAICILKTRGNPDIEVSISSSGGNVGWGLAIYDLLRLYKGRKTAMVYDMAGSMAAVILQACDLRKATRHSRILIHHISSNYISLDALRDKKRLKAVSKDMEDDQDRLYDILISKTGKKRKEILNECAKDAPMTVENALSFGLIDEIV